MTECERCPYFNILNHICIYLLYFIFTLNGSTKPHFLLKQHIYKAQYTTDLFNAFLSVDSSYQQDNRMSLPEKKCI